MATLKFVLVTGALVTLMLSASTTAQDSRFCLLATNGTSLLPSFDYSYSDRLAVEPIQAIILSYQFQCCGNVTMWGAYVQPGNNQQVEYSIQFQVWRQTINGCYTLVGSNTFEAIELTENLVREHVQDKDQIQVQPGDVVGYHLNNEVANSDSAGVLISGIYQNETVRYASMDAPTNKDQCANPTSGLTLGLSTNNAPVITIGFVSSACTPVPTLSIVMPTATPTSPVANTDSDQTGTIIGGSIGGALGVLIIVAIVTVTIIVAVQCKITRKRSSKEKATNEELDDDLYEVIPEVGGLTQEVKTGNDITQEVDKSMDINMTDNKAYISATNHAQNFKNSTQTAETLKDNSAYIGIAMATKEAAVNKNSASEEEAVEDEYMMMAPVVDSSEESNNEYDYVRDL